MTDGRVVPPLPPGTLPAAACRNCGVPARQVTVLPGYTVWRHDVTDAAGVRHVYRWCRLYEAEPGTPNR